MKEFHNNLNSLRTHGKSFYWGSFFLPNQNKLAAAELYSICRYFDDLADDSENDVSEEIKKEYNEIISNDSHEINKFFKKHDINLSILGDLVNGLIKDQASVRINTKIELIEYSYKVAGTVGLMMLPIILVDNPNARKHAIDLGIAMQLTNIARDVYEDARMDRVYLPKEWVGETSAENLKDINNIRTQNNVKNALKKIIKLSEIFYKNGFVGLKYIPFKTRLGIYIAAQVYKGIGDKIKNNEYRYNSRRVFLSHYNKLLITLISLPKFLLIKYIYKDYSKIRDTFKNENL